ncbi:glycosyltransferase family 2 protein [Aeromonas hydrophila]|uniref:glycosyltransferase family 2 protein n=1 Tax=Aeromonas hydrophila TaxID=644 RepID=UPI0014555883|nr:glycosyltransferase family 2 protein [Aeromonas hydrophila]NLR34706.1 glycosyltransferase family 2 protein [Aeromonas hydrophila]
MDRYSKLYVGIPVYNELPYLRLMLDSLKNQTIKDVTFFISDNNSSDGSWEFITDYCKDDARFIFFRHETNIGATPNFEFIFNESNCHYFIWMGAHDHISPGFLQAAVECLDKNNDISIVSGQPLKFVENGDPVLMADAIYNFTVKRLGRYLQSVRTLDNCTIVYSVFRKSALSGFEFRKTISNDHILLSRLLWMGRLHYLENEFYYRRYFESERVQTQSERITGSECYLSRNDMILYYLDDLGCLFDGDPRILRYLENEVISALQHRFGIQALSVNDEVVFGEVGL